LDVTRNVDSIKNGRQRQKAFSLNILSLALHIQFTFHFFLLHQPTTTTSSNESEEEENICKSPQKNESNVKCLFLKAQAFRFKLLQIWILSAF
jgi:hypothetical protein